MRDFSRPGIALGTVLAATVTKEIEQGERLESQSTLTRGTTKMPPRGKPPGRAPPGKAPPGKAPPGKAPAASSNKDAPKAASKGNAPAAPPIHWFYSWIKKEPFGDNVPAPTATPAAPIEKVYASDDDELDLDLTMIDD